MSAAIKIAVLYIYKEVSGAFMGTASFFKWSPLWFVLLFRNNNLRASISLLTSQNVLVLLSA